MYLNKTGSVTTLYTTVYVLATASPKSVMVRCKSATPEWQRHKGTQEQPPGLGWAGLGWAGLR